MPAKAWGRVGRLSIDLLTMKKSFDCTRIHLHYGAVRQNSVLSIPKRRPTIVRVADRTYIHPRRIRRDSLAESVKLATSRQAHQSQGCSDVEDPYKGLYLYRRRDQNTITTVRLHAVTLVDSWLACLLACDAFVKRRELLLHLHLRPARAGAHQKPIIGRHQIETINCTSFG